MGLLGISQSFSTSSVYQLGLGLTSRGSVLAVTQYQAVASRRYKTAGGLYIADISFEVGHVR
jgi:hypothetical protein